MRGVLGIGLVGLGLLMGFLVLSGRFPSTTGPLVGNTPTKNTVTRPAPSHGNVGSGPLGLGTMAYFEDLFASRGAMQ